MTSVISPGLLPAPRGRPPVGAAQFARHARRHVAAREIGAQLLAGDELMRADHAAAIAALAAGQPAERTFTVIDEDAGDAVLGEDLPRFQRQMLRAMVIDAVGMPGGAAGRFHRGRLHLG